jgi:hypothetical protein
MIRRKLDLSHHLISCRFGLLALKGKRGTFPLLPTGRKDRGMHPVDI